MNETVTVNAPGTELAKQFETAAQRAVKFATAFPVESDEDYANAAEELRMAVARKKAVEEARVKITGPLNLALNATNALFKGPFQLYESVERILKDKMLGYQQKQQAIADAARREAEQQAAAERKRLADEAERLRAAGQAEQAEATQLQAEITVATPVVAPAPRAAGVSTAKGIDFEVESKLQFLQFALNPDLVDVAKMLDYINIDSVKLRKAVATHGEGLRWPGIRVFKKETMRVR